MLAKAKRIDNGEEIKGFYIPPNPDQLDGIVVFMEAPMCQETGHKDVYTVTHKIDTNTLKYSLDNGEKWYEPKEIKARVEYCEKLTHTSH